MIFVYFKGMWGFNSALGRSLANEIFKRILDSKTASKFNSNNESPKGHDQFFLSDYVYPLIHKKSIIHDSYLCKGFGGGPWPTKRIGNCFVGSPASCNITGTDFYDCPVECRPKMHPDWKKC